MFDSVVCLNVDKRLGEQGRIRALFANRGLRVSFFVAGDGSAGVPYDHVDVVPPADRPGEYPAWLKRPNSYNAFLCFEKIVARAKRDGVGTLLLVEDDVVLTEDFDRVAQAAWKQVHEVDPSWQALYLGANHAFSRTSPVAPNLLRLSGSGCWHCVCLRSNVFDLVLSLPREGPIDGVFARRVHPGGRCYAAWPNVALSQPGFSLCEGRFVDYTSMFAHRGC